MFTFIYIIRALGLPIILWVIFSDKELKNSKRFEIKYFYNFCYLTLAVNIFSLFSLLEVYTALKVGAEIFVFIDMIFALIEFGATVALGLFWLIFVDAAVFQSPDRIKRRYRKAWYPLVYLAILVLCEMIFFFNNSQFLTVIFIIVYYISAVLIAYTYIRYAWKIARTYSREMSQPLPLRMEYFVVPWLLCFITSFMSIPHLEPLFSSVAAFLMFMVLKRRREYTDDEHGYYKVTYLPELEEYLTKKGRRIKTAILFKNNEKTDALSNSIWDVKPDKSIVVKHSDYEYLIFLDTNKESDAKLLISTVCATVGANITAYQVSADEGESLEQLAVRTLSRGKENGINS